VTEPSTGNAALRALRAKRKLNRLGEVEWFDAAYKVYVAALFGGIALLWLSDLVGDQPLTAAQADDVLRVGPSLLGVIVVMAIAFGLRSGSQGGPLALEAADVAYVMLAPVDRRRALMRPAVQRLRGAAFAGAVFGGSFGQLAGRRLPGTAIAWFASGALFGILVGLAWVGTALVAHTTRLPLTTATAIGLVLIGWQVAAVATDLPGPADLWGDIALWGWRQHPVDLLAVAVAVAIVAIGLLGVGRTSLEALDRRASLVAQLRFAVTMQDLRTVILLRRQLSHEHTRARPWLRLPSRGGGDPVRRRGWHSLLRLPVGRLVRMVALAAAIGACQVAVLRGTTPLVVVSALLSFVLGLEVLEPLSQEVDQPDRTDSFPIERGDLMVRHLVAPAVVLLPFALIGLAVATAILANLHDGPGLGGSLGVGALVALATAYGGAAGSTVSVVRDAPDPMSTNNQEMFLPPEMAGITTSLRMLIPLVVSGIGALSVLLVRAALRGPDPSAVLGTAIRTAVGVVLLCAAVVMWVRKRDAFRRWWRGFVAEGRAQSNQQRSSS
jgi:hypothetical protein